ncbi:hypothetical protein [Kitasatospora paracochleata]|uniref:Uncharacterized protein n=1 Tax=Kitasatospora paracochleata TaxID=58354 RepID=A0ABT1J4I2_9ACTN|nr:hypothetical protein [Kitasatospora paracochleata]MCP2312327.1 hypothetical protein [Kitasatospora paracochleata]
MAYRPLRATGAAGPRLSAGTAGPAGPARTPLPAGTRIRPVRVVRPSGAPLVRGLLVGGAGCGREDVEVRLAPLGAAASPDRLGPGGLADGGAPTVTAGAPRVD